jgi:hypothetical protein
MGLEDGSTGPGEGFVKPKDGVPPAEVTARIKRGIMTTLERFLVVERATRK